MFPYDFLLRNKSRYFLGFLLAVFFLISFLTKYADWKIYRLEVTNSATNDGLKYKNIAQQFLSGEEPAVYLNNFSLRPAFIIYLAGLIGVFGYNSDFIISFINIVIISFFLTLLAYVIFKKYGLKGYLLPFSAAVILILGNPLILFWAPFILTEIPALSLLILGFWIYFRVDNKLKYLFLGIVYALAFQVREVSVINFLALLITMLITKESKWNIAITIFFYFAVIIPWIVYLYVHNVELPFLSHLGRAISAREIINHTGAMPVLPRFLTNIAKHYYLYISDSTSIDTHGYYSIAYTFFMYLMGCIGLRQLSSGTDKKEFYLIVLSLFLTAIFYGFVGESPYMRGRVLVEYLLIYSGTVGLISLLEGLRQKRGQKLC